MAGERIGGVVEFEPTGPAWLRTLLGENAMQQPCGLVVPSDFLPAAMQLIDAEPTIRSLKVVSPDQFDTDSRVRYLVQQRFPRVNVFHQDAPGSNPTGPTRQVEDHVGTYQLLLLNPQFAEHQRMDRLLAVYRKANPESQLGLVGGDEELLALPFWKVRVRVGGHLLELACFQSGTSQACVCLISQEAIIDLRAVNLRAGVGTVAPFVRDVDNDGRVDVALLGKVERIPTVFANYQISATGFVPILQLAKPQ